MTRTALATPEEPDEPEAESSDAEAGDADGDYAEFLRRENPVFRLATYADKDEMFMVHRRDGTHQMMVLEFKDYLEGSVSRSTPTRFLPADEAVVLSLEARRSWYARKSPQKLTGLAVFIAGRERAVLASEWRSHLSGETGSGLSPDRQVREAAGFLRAAVCYRLHDAADFAWRPVDAVLASRGLSNLFVFLATLSVSVLFIRQGGLNGLADNLGSVAVVWGACFGLVHVGRQWRDVKPPERKPRKTGQ